MLIDTIKLVVKSNVTAKQTLDALCSSGRFPAGVLFEGEPGILTDSFALYTAMFFLCKSENKPCGICFGCRKILSGSHIDLVICGENGEKSYNIDAVREIRKRAYIKPNESEKTVFFLSNMDTMPEKSQNALLKVIEEPPQHAVFLFGCENSSKILETIMSRIVPVKLTKPDKNACFEIIKSVNNSFDEEKVRNLLALTNYNLQMTLNLLENKINTFKFAEDIFEYMGKKDIYSVLSVLNEAAKEKITREVLDRLKILIINKTASYIKDENSMSSITPTQGLKLVDMIDRAVFMAEQNVNKSILSCYIASQIDVIINNI